MKNPTGSRYNGGMMKKDCNCGGVPGRIKPTNTPPECPVAYIPVLSVEREENLKGLAGCFVHVGANNTTYYIDGRSRMITAWAGPVEVDFYDYEKNPLGLRSQTVYDFENNRAIYYNKIGEYRLYDLRRS